MTILIIILFILGGFIAFILIVALFVDRHYTITEEVIIQKPNDAVFDFVKQMRNQNQYNKWVMLDPNVRLEYIGADGTEGFICKWESDLKQAGKGQQTIKRVIPGSQVDYDIQFIEPFEGIAAAFLKTNEVGTDTTNVKWSFSSSMKYPMNIMIPIFGMKEMLRKDLALSLNNLKTILEK
ncbi:SRPBCC family protein [Pseudochryseolinea flava]|uniref:Polyketide cyclase n=1 Tax=Pseudochryseolinea flava TaxID=2059302 RepID=A0A364XX70_9BACT|nr:SRPBCC family protein [Pseudochryseolinea flava]RAV98996.1 polyketide cyclase [Pseudochryseolinea flava]